MPAPTSHSLPDIEAVRHVRQARRGAQPAFAALYRRFSPLVHAILLGRFPPAVADELTQECFAIAFSRLDQLKEDGKFGPWIAAIARHAKPPSGPQTTADDDLDAFGGHGAAPEQVAEVAKVLRAIANLPEAYRETLLLRLAEGMSGPEIAALTGLTHQSVRVNLHRGMTKLRAALGLEPASSGDGDDA